MASDGLAMSSDPAFGAHTMGSGRLVTAGGPSAAAAKPAYPSNGLVDSHRKNCRRLANVIGFSWPMAPSAGDYNRRNHGGRDGNVSPDQRDLGPSAGDARALLARTQRLRHGA